MPFGAAVRVATAVFLVRCSAPERVRSIAVSGAVGSSSSHMPNSVPIAGELEMP